MNPSNENDICVLCCREITIYATGLCEHRVCYECSTRMRVLCETNDCPICRTSMPVVIFTHDPQVFTTFAAQYPLRDKKYKIAFEDEEIKKAFYLLLESKCKICQELFVTFDKLKEHIRRKHQQSFCDLCVSNLKIFTFERKYYSKQDLARHRRVGDRDDTSLRGHPLCEFCDLRYVDDDALYIHLRRDHFFCHFCDTDSSSPFYDDYDSLKNHFRSDHYLCEEGDCAREKFVGAFRTAIDLKAHIATCHAKNKSKAEIKQARTLEVGFTYASRGIPGGSSGFRENDPREGRFGQQRKRNIEDNFFRNDDMFASNSQTSLNTQSTHDFPYLSDDVNDGLNIAPKKNSNINSFSVQPYARSSYQRNAMSADDFPALDGVPISVSSESSNNHNRQFNFLVSQNNRSVPQHSSRASAQLSQKNAPNRNFAANHINGARSNKQKAPRFPEFQVDDDSDKETPKTDAKWVIGKKKVVSTFKDNFPRLSSKKKPVEKVSTFKEPKESPPTESEPQPPPAPPNGVVVEETSGGPFVTIKCRSKKKKQQKGPPDSNQEIQEENNKSFKLGSSYVTNTKLDNQENKDPIMNLVTTINLQSPVREIDEAHWEEHVSFVNDDFPPLASSEVKKPPGFDTRVRTPPPGFTTKVKKSGKNSSPLTISLSSIAKQIATSNTDSKSQSSFGNVPKDFDDTYSYGNPLDFDKRNNALIERIRDLSDISKFRDFKTLSGLFRQAKISGKQYHNKCLDLLGEDAFLEIYSELVSLLPDISKQHELLDVHNEFLKHFSNAGAVPKRFCDANPFTVCEICYQVLIQIDYISHKFIYHGVSLPNKKK